LLEFLGVDSNQMNLLSPEFIVAHAYKGFCSENVLEDAVVTVM
jgi:hypothetical protein